MKVKLDKYEITLEEENTNIQIDVYSYLLLTISRIECSARPSVSRDCRARHCCEICLVLNDLFGNLGVTVNRPAVISSLSPPGQ